MTELTDRLAGLYQLDDRTVGQGRLVSTSFLIDTGDQQALISIEHGRVTDIVDPTSMVMPQWRFCLRAPIQEWEQFWSPTPKPGSHDLFALLRRKQLRIDGDIHPFMSNLLYFKTLLAMPRSA